MEKINIAEILKDCPEGMELDCTIWNNVTLGYVCKSNSLPICVRIPNNGTIFLSKYGQLHDENHCKCVIFPKGKTTWEGFVPPCQFEDGDVIYTDNFIAIFSHIAESGAVWYHCYYCISTKRFKAKHDCGIGNINYDEFRFATKGEKQKLLQAIKDNDYKWNPETKTLEKLVPNKFDITTLKPFDKVLVRDSDRKYWGINFFGFYNEITKQFHCMGNSNIGWNECILYEVNQHLLGTTDDCDEYFKNWK